VRATWKKHYEKNKERIAEYRKAWREKNPDKVKEYYRKSCEKRKAAKNAQQ
jgi:hypothetical protein